MAATAARRQRANARLTSAQHETLSRLRNGCRVIALATDGALLIRTPHGFTVAIDREGRWRLVAVPPEAER